MVRCCPEDSLHLNDLIRTHRGSWKSMLRINLPPWSCTQGLTDPRWSTISNAFHFLRNAITCQFPFVLLSSSTSPVLLLSNETNRERPISRHYWSHAVSSVFWLRDQVNVTGKDRIFFMAETQARLPACRMTLLLIKAARRAHAGALTGATRMATNVKRPSACIIVSGL